MKTQSPRIVLTAIHDWSELAMQTRYQAVLLLQHFADQSGVSNRTIEREFRKQLRTTPQKWLDKLRQTQAEKLALDPRIRTKEIASILEYKNVSHFCHHWRCFHGVALNVWRERAMLQSVGNNTSGMYRTAVAH